MSEIRKSIQLAEKIGDNELKGHVLTAINEKSELPVFFVNGRRVRLLPSDLHNKMVLQDNMRQIEHHSKQRLANYSSQIVEWALNPTNPKDGREGVGFSLLIKLILQECTRNLSDIRVMETPARLDFIERSGDILMASTVNHTLKPY